MKFRNIFILIPNFLFSMIIQSVRKGHAYRARIFIFDNAMACKKYFNLFIHLL